MNLTKPIYAQIINPVLPNPEDIINEPRTYFNNVIQTIMSIFFIVATLYFVWHFIMAGYHFMDSRGDSQKLEDAKKELTGAFIGLFIAFSVYALLKLVGTIFGLDQLQQLIVPWPNLL